MHKLCWAFLLFIFNSAFGQIDEVRRITEKLCSPEFHGRGYVNKGDSIAAAFLMDEFKKLGVAPYKKSYLQSFELSVNTFPGEMMVSQHGRKFTPGLHFSIDPSSKGSQERQLKFNEIPSDEVLNISYLKTALDELLSTTSSMNALLFDLTLLSDDTLKQLQGIIPQLAELVPVVELVNKKFTWSVGRSQNFLPYFQIQDSVFDKSAPLDINIDAQFVSSYTSQNVIGYIPTKKRCSKTILFTAHYDHLGRMGSETYFPGANDNASGTAMLFTMARYFKENPSEYNIMFIAFAGEEAGLVGSKYFVDHPILKLKEIEFLLNLDIMGSGEDGVTVVNATLFEKEFELLQQINSEQNLLSAVKKRGPAANSDHYWFTEKGVPAVFIYTSGPNKNYHDIFDQYDALSFLEYEDITTLLVEFVNRLEKAR